MSEKLHTSLFFNNSVIIKTLSSDHYVYNLYTKFFKILEICKHFSDNPINESGNVPRITINGRSVTGRFSNFAAVKKQIRITAI